MKTIHMSFIAFTFLATQLCAQTQTNHLDKISIVTKTQKDVDGVAATVTVITQKEIESIGAQSLKDIIDRAPGLSVQYGTFPSASSKSKSSITIRGMSANGTLFLLDGRRLAGEVQNPYDLERIPAAIIQRIEIVKGPMSSLYGADAVGGVINIITKRPKRNLQIDVGARYGTSEYSQGDNLNLNLSLQGKNERLSYSAYATMTTTEPYTQEETQNVWVPAGANRVSPSKHPVPGINGISDMYTEQISYREESEVLSAGGRLAYDLSSTFTIGADLNYFTEERDGTYIGYFHPSNHTSNGNNIPIFNVPVHSQDENERLDISLDANYAPMDDLKVQAKVYRSYYEKRNTTSAKEYEAMGYASQSASEQNGMNANVDIQVAELSALYMLNESHLLTFGGEYRSEARESSVFTQSSDLTEETMDYKSLYMQDEWQVGEDFSVIAGARYDAISTAKNKSTFRLGGVYAFDAMAKLRVNFAQGYRVPDIREMYIHKQTPNGLQVGANSMGYDLKPEATNAYEIGLGGTNKKLRYDIVFFYNDISNRIAQIMGSYNGNAAYIFENVADAYTRGLELSLRYNFSSFVQGNFYYTELQTRNKETKKELDFQPERTAQLGLDYKMFSSLNLGIFAKYLGKQHYTETLNRGSMNELLLAKKTKDFTLIDFRADYKIGEQYTLYGGINNLTAQSVEDSIGSNVGRYYFVGARARF